MIRLGRFSQGSAVLLWGCLAMSMPMAATYKWVDADGNIQYTQSPPPAGIEAETIAPPPRVDTESAIKNLEAQQEEADGLKKARQESADKEKQAADELALKQKNCEMAQARLKSYEQPRVRFVQEDGSRVYASEEQRQEQIAESQKMIDEFCK